MDDIIICGILIAFGTATLGLGWIFIEGIAAFRMWKKSCYQGKHLKARK